MPRPSSHQSPACSRDGSPEEIQAPEELSEELGQLQGPEKLQGQPEALSAGEALARRTGRQLQGQADPEELDRLRQLLEAGISPSTRRAYRATVETWERWASSRRIAPWPAQPATVALWISDLASDGAKVATVARHVAGLATISRARGLPSPSGAPEVRAALRGLRRLAGTAQRRAEPLLLSDLLAGLPRGQGPREIRDRAVLLLGWAGALRRSEVASIRIEDLTRRPEGLALRLPRSKGDQEAAGQLLGIPRGRAARRGISERSIMRQTRHRSLSVVFGYVRNGNIFLDNPATQLL